MRPVSSETAVRHLRAWMLARGLLEQTTPGLVLWAHPSLRQKDNRALRAAARKMAAVVGIRHPLPLVLFDKSLLFKEKDGGATAGTFIWGKRWACILIASNVSLMAKLSLVLEPVLLDARRFVLAHELAHYEQWRDGRKMQERGVSVRANSLMRKAFEVCNDL